MQEKTFQISAILIKYVHNRCTDLELSILQDWIAQDPKNNQLFQQLISKTDFESTEGFINSIDINEAWGKSIRKSNRKRHVLWYSVAASLIIFFLGSVYLIQKNKNGLAEEAISINSSHDILPADLGAKLTLANGQEVNLEKEYLSVKSGVINIGNEESIVGDHLSIDDQPIYHLLEVPKANYFKMSLPDGTIVWLNAMSSLKFPLEFGSQERKIYLTGEAFFEVAKDLKRPFIVNVEGKEIKVLGTKFNVNAYHHQFKTTLIEGSVEVNNGDITQRIVPGQSVAWSSNRFIVNDADLDKVLAWRNNEFYFKMDNIVQIASQLMMWYNLDVKIDEKVSKIKTYSGSIQRDVNLSEVLSMLSFVSNIDFEINNNQLIIKNKSL